MIIHGSKDKVVNPVNADQVALQWVQINRMGEDQALEQFESIKPDRIKKGFINERKVSAAFVSRSLGCTRY